MTARVLNVLLTLRVRPCRPLAVLVAMLVVAAASGGQPNEPAKKPSKEPPAAKAATPRKRLDGLGFSVAPKEGGKARTSFFGLVGEGYKFVYVFDRSGSMGGDGRKALRAVKAELIESLKNLDTVHQFQIVYYNERPVQFNPSGNAGRLAFATDENKDRAASFLDAVTPSGGTDHEAALRLAVRLHPDVIYFLTDGDDPKMTATQLEKIRDLAAGVLINTVEFGPGPKPEEPSFLAKLAEQNGGGYTYVDLSKRRDKKKPANAEK
ncbi:MAG: VWA domain-containing protein [Thermoguttaceae bacterium]